MELFDEENLANFIREKFKVSTFRIPFYLKWIKMYKSFTKNNGSGENIKAEFINSLNNRY